MALIFLGSTDALSGPRTSRLIGPVLRWAFPDISPGTITHVQLAARKTGHLLEYALLAVLISRALQPSSPGTWSKRGAALTLLLCALYACSDEWHQSFVASRYGSARDVLLDVLGALAGLTLHWRFLRSRQP